MYLNNDFACKLISRDTNIVHSSEAQELISNKTILVTGGAGSIGSEVVRQCLKLNAKKVYVLDNDEYALYRLCLELHDMALLDKDIFILADICDRQQIANVFSDVKPDIVFHCAAKKHLPLLERSPASAIKTNVFGTDNVIDTCLRFLVETVINVSTDKAANPVSVLGMSKRLAELRSASYASENITRIANVRFGNVIGSRGSFLPTLAYQIENDKKVTVTDKRVTRYFMTIPEAASLIIEASVMANSGETYLLDMGNPILIMDIIDRYVHLTGFKYPEIVYTGLRTGEKLHEELNSESETSLPTKYKKINKILSDSSTVHDGDLKNLEIILKVNSKPEKIKECLSWLLNEIEGRKKKQEMSFVQTEMGEVWT